MTESIYVYAGENKPKIQLTKIKNVPRIEEIIRYLHKIQDIFQLQLNFVETITGNLKIKSVFQSDDMADVDKPFYILEYCEDENSYSLWKSNSEWKLSLAIASLYGATHCQFTQLPTTLNEKIKSEVERHATLEALKELKIKDSNRVDWSICVQDVAHFFETQGKGSDEHQEIDVNRLKTTIALSLLKSMVQTNKAELGAALLSYDKSVHELESTDSSTLGSRESSLKPPSVIRVEPSYTHVPSTQLQSNFQNFFQSMAENFETYDTEREPSLKSLNLLPSRQNSKNKISKTPAGQAKKQGNRRVYA